MQYHQARRKTKWYMADMELLQYDLLYGERYAYGEDGESPYEPTDMQMGIHQPYIRNVVALEGTTYVFGQNFTTASKIYVDGEYQSTSFINDHVLRLKKTVLDSDAEIAVKQLAPGKARRVLSEGNTYSFHYEEPEEEVSTDTESTDTESTDALDGGTQETDAQNTDTENTDAQEIDAQNTDTQNTGQDSSIQEGTGEAA